MEERSILHLMSFPVMLPGLLLVDPIYFTRISRRRPHLPRSTYSFRSLNF